MSSDYFNQNTWAGLAIINSEKTNSLYLLMASEITFNFMLFVLALYVLFLFYSRKTSLPLLISIYYMVAIVGPIVDWYLADQLLAGQGVMDDTSDSAKDIAKSIISAAIWIPYFNLSERSKNTFCRQSNVSGEIWEESFENWMTALS